MMSEFIIRVIKLLVRVKIIKDVHIVRYTGSFFSLNELYSQKHWSSRSKIKNKYSSIFRTLCYEAHVKPFKSFYLVVVYSSKHDVDNIVGMSKVFVDSMKDIYVKDDSQDYYKGILIFHNENLPNNTIDFLILTTNGQQD